MLSACSVKIGRCFAAAQGNLLWLALAGAADVYRQGQLPGQADRGVTEAASMQPRPSKASRAPCSHELGSTCVVSQPLILLAVMELSAISQRPL